MIHARISVARRRWFSWALTSATFTCGCTGSIGDGTTPAGGGQRSQGNSANPSPASTECAAEPATAHSRIVRLTFNQIGVAVRGLLGDTAGQAIVDKYEIGDLTKRSFPPLLSPREGIVVTDAVWQKADGVASSAGQYVFDNFATATGCGVNPKDTCGQQFVSSFAERAYRRPLVQRERDSLLQVYAEATASGASVQEAVQFGVYAALESPHFLYRTEWGDARTAPQSGLVALSPNELANELSFFLIDGPPDQNLLDAAARGELEVAGLTAQVDRLLGTDAARKNLEAAMFAYFSLTNLDNVVIDPTKFPDWNTGLKNSMYTESEQFMKSTLWKGQLADLLTSRSTLINDKLAKIYEVAFPPPGAILDQNGFASVELPAVRSGLLTQAGFLVARSRPDKDSVVGRGLVMNAALLCANNPPFPQNLADTIKQVSTTLANSTEREKADYRATHQPCQGCHTNFDPYGLVLESFDALGNHRTVDPAGRPIDPSATMPAVAGGKRVADAVAMATELASNGAFAACMTRNLMQYALSEGPVDIDGCAVRTVSKKFLGGSDKTFAGLLRGIAVSDALRFRSSGGAQ